MNLAAALAIAAGALAIGTGVVARAFSRAPGWAEQRWFALVAFGAATYAFGNLGTTLAWSDEVVTVLSRLQLAAVYVQIWAWARYVDEFAARSPGPWERRLGAGLLLVAALCLVPGVAYRGEVVSHEAWLLGTECKDAVPTTFGEVLFGAGLAAALVILGRIVQAWRRGRTGAGPLAVAFGAIFLFGVNDALAASGVLPVPYLLDIGFMVPVGAVAWAMTRRFVADAEALDALRARLETLVAARTRALSEAEGRLHQAEKLAALGQFAAGVAHEVNNPASVVGANLRFLADTAEEGGAPAEAQASIRESIEAMERIRLLVRRLVDAGRVAAAPAAPGAASVAAVVEQAVTEVRARVGDRVAFTARVAAGAQAALPGEVLARILGALLHNAADAIPAGRRGLVEVTVERDGPGLLRLSVQDDGVGMAPEVARRAFEPFFTTKVTGQGSGLGLPVAQALAERHGGELRLESQPGRGTRATLDLPVL